MASVPATGLPSTFWRPVIDARRLRHRPSSVSTGDLVSLFLNNIPETMTARDLFSVLNKFVKVFDVFIPGKRRIVTKSRFGFVKVKGHSNADVLIRKVSFQRKFYVDTLKGHRVETVTCSPSPEVHVQKQRTHWLYCSPIDTLLENKDVRSFKEEFLRIHPLPFQSTDYGGKLLLLTFLGRGDRERALNGEVMALLPWFCWIKPWSNECQPGVHRDAWIKCSGLPHQLWSHDDLAKIGRLWGDVLHG
ncbi:hypothetical protein Dimus_001784 [Dionaea muscipula]